MKEFTRGRFKLKVFVNVPCARAGEGQCESGGGRGELHLLLGSDVGGAQEDDEDG